MEDVKQFALLSILLVGLAITLQFCVRLLFCLVFAMNRLMSDALFVPVKMNMNRFKIKDEPLYIFNMPPLSLCFIKKNEKLKQLAFKIYTDFPSFIYMHNQSVVLAFIAV